MNPVFSKLHHVCIVVHDIDTTQRYYESIGIGPWVAYPPLTEYEKLQVPSTEGFMAMQYCICNLPDIQLQLCQPDHNPSPQRLHLDTKGEGVFHLGFEVPDADAAEASVGLPVLMKGRRANRTGFTYYETAEKAGVTLLTRATFRPGT
jgi:catechol 2,3-dioxygenase-like lactoylglutathione lyase family enzyme